MKRFKIFKQLKEYLDKNIIFKVSICIILVVILVAVLILGSIYSNNLNKRNLSLVVTKSNDEDLTNKQEEEKRKAEEKKKEEEKKVKLQELKDKIKELDENVDLTITIVIIITRVICIFRFIAFATTFFIFFCFF